MESLHSFLRRHWDDEPLDVPRRTERAYKSDPLQTLRARSRVRGRRVSVWSACVFSAAFPRQGGTRCLGRIMESPHDFDAVHWDHEPVWVVPSVWCPAFRRPGPAKAGTPNRRFMERVIAPPPVNSPIADATPLLRLSFPHGPILPPVVLRRVPTQSNRILSPVHERVEFPPRSARCQSCLKP